MDENTKCCVEQETAESKESFEKEIAPVSEPKEKNVSADQKPPKGSRYELISIGGYIGILLLLAVPVVGPVLTIVWALGGCRKQQKRNFARANLILGLVGLFLTGMLIYAGVQAVDRVMEQLEEQYDVGSIEDVRKLVEGAVTGNFEEGSEQLISDMIGSYISSEVELTNEEQEQLDQAIGALVNGEITIDKEQLDLLLGQLESEE